MRYAKSGQRKPRLTTGIEDFPSSVTVRRDRHPLQGCELRVLGRMRRHGAAELLVVLPDGSKTLLPAVFTDAAAAADVVAATVGSIGDREAAVAKLASLIARYHAAEGSADDHQ